MLKVVASSGRVITQALAGAIARLVKREFGNVPTVLVTNEELSEDSAKQIAHIIHSATSDEELGELVQICVTEADLEEGGPIIMSRSNPCGYSVEYLIRQLRIDLTEKIKYIADDHSMAAEMVRNNNSKIISLLDEMGQLAEITRADLDRFAKDPGPTGKPRIGLGSDNVKGNKE